ncbi:uncharacterized protein LOC129617409 [Condylostylus longicornis]|uniref:uncharacterized protein LOC129617409 n=1 Tax=Condylostylus longicornis TaxID=2530218 RepID=UPI00244DA92F|nr:uncharacterized protein LOC129617409 [Condylostylus longicornis]
MSENGDTDRHHANEDPSDSRAHSRNEDSDPTAEGKSVLIKNLKFETSPAKVRKIFEKYGAVRDVYIPLDYFSRRPRGFAFVEFFSADDAGVAVKSVHKTVVDGNEVRDIDVIERPESNEL